MIDALPRGYERWLEGLGASAWRERKQAVEALQGLINRDRASDLLLEAVAERLLGGLVSPEALEGRAACHDVLKAIGAPALPGLLRRLDEASGSDVGGTRLLVDLLGEIGDPSHASRLERLVSDDAVDPNLRCSAAVALGRLGGDPSHLTALLTRGDDMLVVHALDALREARVAVPIAVLEPLIDKPFTRKAAATLLGSSADPKAAALLLPLLEDAMAGVRAVAALALVELDESLRDPEDLAAPTPIAQAMPSIGEPARAWLRKLIEHRSRDIQAAAIRLAGMAQDSGAVRALLTVMDDPLIQEEALVMVSRLGAHASEATLDIAAVAGAEKREQLLRLIGALTDGVGPALRSLLTQSLEEGGEDTPVAAAEALERVGDRSSLAELYRALGQPGRVGEAAADAISAIVVREAAEPELDLIVGSTWPQEGELARNLCRVVGSLGSQRYAPHLVSLLGSPDVGVRVAAAQALGRLPGDHEGPSALSFALTDEEPHVRAAACRSLGQVGAPGAVNSVLSATQDRSALVRAAAVQALVALDNPVALARLRAVVVEDPVPTVVVQAIAGLGMSGLDQDLTMLMSLCTSEDWEVVKAAARALIGFKAHRATAALLGLLGHERWDVRWAAAEVLGQRGDSTALEPLRRVLEDEDDSLVRDVVLTAIAELEGASGR